MKKGRSYTKMKKFRNEGVWEGKVKRLFCIKFDIAHSSGDTGTGVPDRPPRYIFFIY